MKHPFRRTIYSLPLLILFLPVIAEGMIVHGDLSINDTQKGGRERSVYASGARYRITVTLDEEHYVYKGLSIDVDKKETDIIVEPGTESEKYDVTDGTFYRKWIWQTPALAPGTKCTVTLHGWRIRKGPGVGPAVWEEFTSTRTAELLSPIVTVENPAYDRVVSVDPGEEVIIWIKVVADNTQIIEREVSIKFKAVDPDKPADNEGTDQKFDPADAVTETSSTNGKGSIKFYVSTNYGDNYRVWAWYEKAPEPSKVDTTQQSGLIIVGFKIKIISVTPPNDNISFTTKKNEDEIHSIADIKPDSYDEEYNKQIEWEIDDDPNTTGYSGDPKDPEKGDDVKLIVTAPSAPNGRGFPLNYRIRASLTIAGNTITSDPEYIKQDDRDQLRQQYEDLKYNHFTPPTREELSTSIPIELRDSTAPGGWNWDAGISTTMSEVESAYGHSFTVVSSGGSGYRTPIHNELYRQTKKE